MVARAASFASPSRPASRARTPSGTPRSAAPVALAAVVASAVCGLGGALVPRPAGALDLGFEAFTSVISTDNVGGDNAPDEERGVIGTGLIGVYGEQRSRLANAAFTGEIDGRRRFDDEDQRDIDSVTRFLGAAEFRLTPRVFRWYVGDILGGVRADNALQPISDNIDTVRRRNVFVTGPSAEFELDTDTTLSSRVLYVNQTEEGEALETLWSASVDWRRRTTPGSFFGASLVDIYTDGVEVDDIVPGTLPQGDTTDFNRLSAAVFGNRVRGLVELYGQLGVTRYDADEESLNGLNAALRATRTLGPDKTLTLELTRDLQDQTLTTVESLIDDGEGLQPEADGFFDETRLELVYGSASVRASVDAGVGVAQRDFRELSVGNELAAFGISEDQLQSYAFGILTRPLAPRLRAEFGLRYERQTFDERDDEADSVLGSARLLYALSRDFELEAGYVFDRAEGTRTLLVGGALVNEAVDVTENRFNVGLRWAPPSRASRDLTIELKSLLR